MVIVIVVHKLEGNCHMLLLIPTATHLPFDLDIDFFTLIPAFDLDLKARYRETNCVIEVQFLAFDLDL